jgi:hypothetical protein
MAGQLGFTIRVEDGSPGAFATKARKDESVWEAD